MNISYNWLKQYVDIDLPPGEVADMLTGCGLEIEGVERWQSVRGGLEGIVTGEVVECTTHPNADKLTLTKVSLGGADLIPIVCGAPNVAAGQKVLVATVGASLWFSDTETVIRKTKIRGELSEGMICAEDELGLGSSHEGIMVLDGSVIPGRPAKEYFEVAEDVIFQIGLTPNRSDATSHIGTARDLVAVMNNAGKEDSPVSDRSVLNLPDVSEFLPGKGGRQIVITVEDESACPRYSGLTITDVKVGESPEWLQNRMLSVGLRPINNIVDISNYVLMEMGQPLHAFDADKIDDDRVVVKTYPEGTTFTTLDEEERKLTANDMMISSASRPMCIAGVFGGIHSGVTESTTNIFLESACFDPVSVRQTARHHGLQTDASFRFERGTDIEITTYALKRAALMIREIAGGEIASGIVDVYPARKDLQKVTLRYSHLDRLTGKKIPHKLVKSILEDLGIRIENEYSEKLELSIPSFKVDVTREADVIEEVLRIYGYNNIEVPEEMRASLSFPSKPDPDKIRNIISDLLCSNGFFEIMNNSLTTSAYYRDNTVYAAESCVRIINPSSRDLDVMRRTLLYGGLETIAYNLNRKAFDLKLFETGSVYSLAGTDTGDPLPGYHEEQRFALFLTGRKLTENWDADDAMVDIIQLKGVLHAILKRISIDPAGFTLYPLESPLFSSGFTYIAGEQPEDGEDPDDFDRLITAGVLRKSVLNQFDIRQPVLYADFNWDLLLKLIPGQELQYVELPKFPIVRRDLALLLDKGISFDRVREIAFRAEKKILHKVGLFDVYEGDQVEKGSKSYAVSFLLGDETKTLTDKEIDSVMDRLVKAFRKELGAQIR